MKMLKGSVVAAVVSLALSAPIMANEPPTGGQGAGKEEVKKDAAKKDNGKKKGATKEPGATN